MTAGATKRDWLHFQHVLGFGADLLPVVPDKDAVPSPLSKVKVFGKIPSMYNQHGEAHGIAQWQKREITEDEVEHWSNDRRLSLCVRARAVRAIDVDITDPKLAERVRNVLDFYSPHTLARRVRANSSKFLCPILLAGEYAKRIIDCGPEGRIEFLADGQQWLIAGGHESGSMYEWVDGLPESIPRFEPEEFEAIWTALEHQFAVAPASKTGPLSGVAPEYGSILTTITDDEEADLAEALRYPPLVAAAGDNDYWSEIGYALLSLGNGWLYFHGLSMRAPNYDGAAAVAWWETHAGQTPRSDFRHIFTLARRLGWRSSAEPSDFPLVEAKDPNEPVIKIEQTIKDLIGKVPDSFCHNTDLQNAHRLHNDFGGTRIIFGRGCFYAWTGKYWERSETEAKRCAAELPRIVKFEADELRPKLEALIEAAPLDVLEQFDKLKATRRADRVGSAAFKLIGFTDLWRTYSRIEDLDVWARQCESESTQAAAARLLRIVMEIL